MTTPHNYTNKASVAQLGANMDAVTDELTVSAPSYSGWPAAPFWGLIGRGTPSAELVEVTEVVSPVLTVVRAQGGFSASSHNTGDTFEHVIPAAVPADYELHKDAATGVHGVSGSVVGTSGSQTVQDKTFRGAHRSVFSDALPAGVTASFESTADNASARDGFVHRSTAGDVDRRAFLSEQSGTPRVQVFNDGTVKLSPGASARPGLENDGTTQLDGNVVVNGTLTTNAAVENNSTTQLDGAVTVNAAATFNNPVELNSTAQLDGAATFNSTAEFNSTVQLDGAITANANADFNNDVNVDGAFTPKTVTLQNVGGGDTAPRILVKTNLTTDALRVTDNASVLQLAITGGGGINTIGDIFTFGKITANGHVFAEGSTIPVIPVVSSLASITSPVVGMLAYLTTDGLLYRRTATPAWVVHDQRVRRLGGRRVTTAGNIHTGIAGTEVNITKLAFEDTAVSNGRVYVPHVRLVGTFSAANNSFIVRVRKDTALTGTVIAQWEWVSSTAGFSDSGIFFDVWPCTADDADADFYVSIQRAVGGGAGTLDLVGASRCAFWIDEDVDGGRFLDVA